MSKPSHTLTGDDLSIALFGIAHMSKFWQAQRKSEYRTRELKRLRETARKLNAIVDHAYPLQNDDEGTVLDFGDEAIMRIDARVVAQSQRRLVKAGAVR